jgi:hypothetical protein
LSLVNYHVRDEVNALESEQHNSMDWDDKQTTTAEDNRTGTETALLSVWFLLRQSSNGAPIGEQSKVKLPKTSDIDDLKKAVKLKCPNRLRGVDLDRLQVFAPNADIADSSNALRPDALVPSTTGRLPLIVVAPVALGYA